MNAFSNSVVIITGGGSGIGKALSISLAAQGALVHLFGLKEDRLEDVHQEIISAGGNCEFLHVDVTDYPALKRAILAVKERHGHIDYLFNNAGITLLAEAQDIEIERWNRIVDVNLMGVVNGIQIAYPLMINQGSGHIINTASLAGIAGYPTSAIYAATKSAVIRLTEDLQLEAEDYGVRFSVVCPGYVKTNIFEGSDRIIGGDMERTLSQIPFKMISPEQAAASILAGVKKNKIKIIFPAYARLTATINRLAPWLLRPISKKLVSDFKADISS